MKVEKTILEEKLKNIIGQYGDKRNFSIEFINKSKGKLRQGLAYDILALRIPVETLTSIQLGVVTQTISEVNKSIKVTDYFTDKEIDVINGYEVESDEKISYPLIFKNVIRLQEDQFLLSLSMQEIAELYNSNIIKYNAETQRQLIVKESREGIIKQIDINKKSVDDITEELKSDLFIPNMITFNLLADGRDYYKYDNGELKIISGEINIADGFHRSIAILNSIIKNPSINKNFVVMITSFNVQKMRKFIVQEEKRNIMKVQYIKSLDDNNLGNQIVKKLNEDSEFHLVGQFSNNYLMLKTGQKKVDSYLFADVVEQLFLPKDRKDMINYFVLIRDRLNYIIESNTELLDTTIQQNVWVYYLCLIYKSKGIVEDWKKFLKSHITVPTKFLNKTMSTKLIKVILSEID